MASTRVRIGYALLGAALLGGAGALAAANGYLRAPLPPAGPHLVTAESVCAWQSAGTSIAELVPWLSSDSEVADQAPDPARYYTGVAITSPGEDLVLPVGVSTAFPVHVTNIRERELQLPEGSGPVLVATAAGDPAVVVGYAFLDHAPAARALAPDEIVEHRDFGAFVACPGAPTGSDGVHLGAGGYRLLAGQALGLPTKPESAPFNTWAHFGTLELTDREPAEALPEDSPSATPEPARVQGSCGSPTPRAGTGATEGAHFTARPRELVSVSSAAPEVEVRHINATLANLRAPAKGGPVILVAEAGTVVAMSRTTDPVPMGDLGAGEEFTYTAFEPLVHCETGEPLPVGRYEFYVGRLLVDPAVTVRRLVDFLSPPSVLVVTDRTDVPRTVVERPDMPVCGDAVPAIELTPGALRTTVDFFDVIEVEGPGETGGGGAGPDNTVIELTVVLDEPLRDQSGVAVTGWQYVLVRDGVVVGVMRRDFGFEDLWTGEPGTFDRDELTVRLDDCAAEVDFTPLVLDGEYTLYGYVSYITDNPLGVRDEVLVAVGPHDFTHHPPAP